MTRHGYQSFAVHLWAGVEESAGILFAVYGLLSFAAILFLIS